MPQAATTAAAIAALLAGATGPANAFYVPGVNPQSFLEGGEVLLRVNSMTSHRTLMPMDYYSLPFCRPERNGSILLNQNLGMNLAGNRIQDSPYILSMKKDLYCAQLCYKNVGPKSVKGELSGEGTNEVDQAITKRYHNNWIVDNLSAASKVEDDYTITTRYWMGFPIGFKDNDTGDTFLHNHVNIEIQYNPVDNEPGKFHVVGFTVEPFSIKHEFTPIAENHEGDRNAWYPIEKANITNPIASCNPRNRNMYHTSYEMVTDERREPQPAYGDVLFTYDVQWVQNDHLKWASRWDIYLSMDNAIPQRIRQLPLIFMFVIAAAIAASIAVILIKNLREDLDKYNHQLPGDEESSSILSSGWRAVHADVFRPPSSPLLLSAACGSGAQILSAAVCTTTFASLGFASSARRGELVMVSLLAYVFMGIVSGYVSARLYKTFSGERSYCTTAVTATAFPSLAFLVFGMVNVVAASNSSTLAVPMPTILVLLVCWLGILTPLVFLGSHLGYRKDVIEYPVETSSDDPHPVPGCPWPVIFFMLGGILSFAVCFVEFYFIMATSWMEYFYHQFWYLLLVLVLLSVVCGEIALLCNYYFLNRREDYHWWWRSFWTAGSVAICIFVYSFVYVGQLDLISSGSYAIFFGYMSVASIGIYLATGFVGVVSALWFNIKIYGALKSDQALS